MSEQYVIYDPISGDQLSVPMTLKQCKYIEQREYEIQFANEGGDAWRYAITTVADLKRIQRRNAFGMSGNPPKTRIIYDGPWGGKP